MNRRRLAVLVALSATLVMLAAGPAGAHPLGNFTTNKFTGLEISESKVVVHYVVDFAEVAAFQELPAVDTDGDDETSVSELDAYAEGFGRRMLEGIGLRTSDGAVELTPVRTSAELLPGQAGLDILRVEVDYEGTLTESETSLEYIDRNFVSRIGWKEIIAYTSGGQGIAESNVPSKSISDELRAYPRALLKDPLQKVSATVAVDPGATSVTADTEDRAVREVERAPQPAFDFFAESFTALVDDDISPMFLFTALLLAIAFGAAHALGPGHGKTVMAAYLVGTEGRPRHALMVGAAISLMHTISVVALGLITLWASSLFPPETVFPWLSLASGLIVVGLGAWLLRSRIRARRPKTAQEHSHSHDHTHDHSHDHGHSHGHSHLPADASSPLSWRGLGALAVSGGLLPSPSALLVLLGAVAIHRVALGIYLVAAFSIGLAGALTLLGILVLRARGFAARKLSSGLGTLLPVMSAVAVLVVGLALTANALEKF